MKKIYLIYSYEIEVLNLNLSSYPNIAIFFYNTLEFRIYFVLLTYCSKIHYFTSYYVSVNNGNSYIDIANNDIYGRYAWC